MSLSHRSAVALMVVASACLSQDDELGKKVEFILDSGSDASCLALPTGKGTQLAALCCIRLRSAVEVMANLREEEVASLFGGLLPAVSKAQAVAKNGRNADTVEDQRQKWQKHKGKGRGNKGQSKPASLRSWQDEGDQGESRALQMLIQLCLRQEDSINMMRMDRAYLMLFKTKGEETLLPIFKDIADKWKEHRAAGTTEAPLRVALFKCLALELQSRAKLMMETKLEDLVKLGWVIKKRRTWSLAGFPIRRRGTTFRCQTWVRCRTRKQWLRWRRSSTTWMGRSYNAFMRQDRWRKAIQETC